MYSINIYNMLGKARQVIKQFSINNIRNYARNYAPKQDYTYYRKYKASPVQSSFEENNRYLEVKMPKNASDHTRLEYPNGDIIYIDRHYGDIKFVVDSVPAHPIRKYTYKEIISDKPDF